jgi:large subunit ribosomal protein L25
MATVNLSANPRSDMGKGAARKLRAQGLMPAVIYRAGQPATSISLDPHALEQAFRKTGNRNTLVDLAIDGNNFVCLVKATQRDPVDSKILHVDFYEVSSDEYVVVDVPVSTTGKAAGEVEGGKMRIIKRDLRLRCKPADIPDTIVVDVSELSVGDFTRVSGIVAPSGATIIAGSDFNVVTVLGKRADLEVEAAVESVDSEEATDEEATEEGGE